jgi:RHS repeat-associated protein
VTGSYQTDDSVHLVSLPLMQTVYDGNWNEAAQTLNEYDNYSNDGYHAPLQDYGSVIGHDGSYGASKVTRGNLTSVGHWLNTNNTTIYSYLRYDILGSPVGNKDPNGNLTTLSYTDDFGDGSNPGSGSVGTYGATYAYPTLLTSPPPQAGQNPHTARSQYDFSTGLLTGFKDRNSIVTQTLYKDPATNVVDPFNRPRLVKAALGVSGVENHTMIYYAQATPITVYGVTLTNNDVLTAKDQTTPDDATLRSWTHSDGFGRTTESWTRDPLGDDEIKTIYDALGRGKQVSNPFRPSLGQAPIYTTTGYDLAGRVTSVTTPDNAAVTTAYSANTVTVTDQAGKTRKSVTDGLGRLAQVYEAPSDSNYNYLTSYGYDTLDNLTSVTQGAQPSRNFNYDSLKRLTSANNPESGTITYHYDSNGNLTQKTDARSVTSNMSYDALNRLTYKSYTDGTAAVEYHYDTYYQGVGRISYIYDGGAGQSMDMGGYDAMGRPLGRQQAFWNGSAWKYYQTWCSYDLAGHLTWMQYPSGHTVNYKYDAAGRLADSGGTAAFTGNLGDGAPRNYDSISGSNAYDAASRMQEEKFGTTTFPLYHKQHFNIRGQLYDNRLSTLSWSSDQWNYNRGAILNWYDSTSGYPYQNPNSGTDNNGNVLRSEVWIPNDDQISSSSYMRQNYGYDSLNRLTSVSEFQNGSSQSYAQIYNYDRWGNRTISSSTWGYQINSLQTWVDPNSNRQYALNDSNHTLIDYDAAGNQTKDYLSWNGTRAYDAENRMMSASNGTANSYTYDGEGYRVRRNIGGTETWQVYDVRGELLAEYAANAATSSPQKEYGYRNGQLLVTLTPGSGGGGQGTQNVVWTNAVGVSVSGNNLTKTAADGWGNGGASSTQSITPGDGYVEFTATETDTYRMCGLSHGDDNQDYTDIDYAIYLTPGGIAYAYQYAVNTWVSVSFVAGDHFRISIDNGVLNFRKNGVAFFTNNSPTLNYPLLVDTSLYSNGSTLTNVVISGNLSGGSSGTDVEWIVTDHLGTPRIIADATGSLAGIKRHDYLPFGEELFAGQGGRTTPQGYPSGPNAIDEVRQKFTQKERDAETGLDYFLTRYYSSAQGRFTSYDVIFTTARRLIDPQRLNLYAYARNNPLKFIDPDGMDITLTAKNEDEARKRFNIFLLGLRPQDRSHVHFFVGNGRHGYARGQFYVLVDTNYRSDSENFQAIQRGANDRTSVGRITVLHQGDTYTVRFLEGSIYHPTLRSISDTYEGKKDFQGYTVFQIRGKGAIGELYSAGNYTESYVNGDQDDVELAAAMHHEIRAHLILGDFGRNIPRARHSDAYARGQGAPTSEADKVGEAAEKEAKENAAKKP